MPLASPARRLLTLGLLSALTCVAACAEFPLRPSAPEPTPPTLPTDQDEPPYDSMNPTAPPPIPPDRA
ncbi:hypothetical protein D8I30_02775 [Brevundimonas naejangsanensis]|uniref:Uncharacterized protein n=1 Tax=Brevundimonas naejangsanensis TaxID=588932 RepID=A0A494RD37_9CAUL|nr:hypothetical protein [Brevundimonas naejangsanensis]AYG94228.1 hypothetical protein D8I30_02775 [Brevundimonas naejangsanensis]